MSFSSLRTAFDVQGLDGAPAPAARVFTPRLVPGPETPAAARDPDHVARLGENSTGDLPVTVGWLIVSSYLAILGAFGLTFAGDAQVGLVLGVCAVYLAVYLGVPTVMLRIEPKAGRRPDMADFVENGLQIFTGWVSARAAIAQMLTIPVAVAIAAAGIGIIIRLSA